MIPLYCGYDKREAAGFHTFVSSVIERASEPVAFIPTMGKQRDGTNAFTYARFLIPEEQRYTGWAIFADAADMVCLGDIAMLWLHRDESKAVMCVKHDYQTRHPRKYVGTAMESDNRDYPRKNWSSLMLMNCGHPLWKQINDRSIGYMSGAELHRFAWIPDEQIGELPPEWNVLVDEGQSAEGANLLHWTAGIPGFPEYSIAPSHEVWDEEFIKAMRAG